jgi:hypothetical protein
MTIFDSTIHEVCAWWVLKELTEKHKHNHVSINFHRLEWYHSEGYSFLNCIITGDKTWMHHYETQSKCHEYAVEAPTIFYCQKFKSGR